MDAAVYVLAMDDAVINFDRLTLPQGYRWHPASRQKLKLLTEPATAHHALYSRFVQVLAGVDEKEKDGAWPGLRGTAILILDLSLEIPEFPHQDYLKESFGADVAGQWGMVLQGFHAATAALTNPNWTGLIALTSTVLAARAGRELFNRYKETVAPLLRARPADRHVEIIKIDDAINYDPQFRDHNPQMALDRIIEEFRALFPDTERPSIEHRLWPQQSQDWWLKAYEPYGNCDWMNSTEHWFDSGLPAHDWNDEQNFPHGIERVRAYLHNLLGFSTPDHWYGRDQLPVLWEEIKTLVGAHANAHTDGGRPVSLAAMFLVTSAALGSPAAPWLDKQKWQVKSMPVVPDQDRLCARDAIVAWARLFECFRVDKFDAGRTLLQRIQLLAGARQEDDEAAGGSLQIELAFDANRRNGTRPSLLERFRSLEGDGRAFPHLKSFTLNAACDRKGNRKAVSVLNLLARGSAEAPLSIFELVPVIRVESAGISDSNVGR